MPVNVETLLSSSVFPALNATSFTDLVFWSKTSLYEWAQEAVLRLARSAAGLIYTDTRAISALVGDYPLPVRTLSVLHVSAAGRTLRPANVRDLEARSSNWRGKSAAALTHYVRQDQGLTSIRVFPLPTSLVTGSVRATVHVAPAAVTEGSPTLDWPDVLSGYVALRVIERARTAETEAKMPEAAAIAGQICGLVEQAALKLWGGVQ